MKTFLSKKKLVRKLLILTAAIGFTTFYSTQALAQVSYCTLPGTTAPGQIQIDFPTVQVSNAIPAGATIKNLGTSNALGPIARCLTAGSAGLVRDYTGGIFPATSDPNVIQTNLSGIGIRLSYRTSGGTATKFPVPAQQLNLTTPPTPPGYWTLQEQGGYTVELVRTAGSITYGSITTGKIGQNSVNGLKIVTIFVRSGGTIQAPTCDITAPNIAFPIGSVEASELTTIGSSNLSPVARTIVSNNCPAIRSVTMNFAGTPDAINNKLFALTGAGTAGVAAGIGVDLRVGANAGGANTALPEDTPVEPNQSLTWLMPSGGVGMFPFTARYTRTGTLRVGTANSTITVNITYN